MNGLGRKLAAALLAGSALLATGLPASAGIFVNPEKQVYYPGPRG